MSLTFLAAACSNSDSETSAQSPESSETSQLVATTPPPVTDSGSVGEDTSIEVVETRTVETALGPVEIPVDPQRVLALDENAAMNLLAVGITPLESLGASGSDIVRQILADHGVNTTDVADAMTLNFELIAAMEPDVIVMTAESAFLGNYDDLSAIAPTITLLYSEPWRTGLETTGATFGREARASQLIGLIEGRLAEIEAMVADAEDVETLSILGSTFGIDFGVSRFAPLAEVVIETGLTQPVAQSEADAMAGYESVVPISLELMEGHDADLVVVLSGDFYDETAILGSPTFQALPAVKDGRSFVIDGDMWFSTDPFAIFWILEDIENLISGEGQPGLGTFEDTADRWASYKEFIG